MNAYRFPFDTNINRLHEVKMTRSLVKFYVILKLHLGFDETLKCWDMQQMVAYLIYTVPERNKHNG